MVQAKNWSFRICCSHVLWLGLEIKPLLWPGCDCQSLRLTARAWSVRLVRTRLRLKHVVSEGIWLSTLVGWWWGWSLMGRIYVWISDHTTICGFSLLCFEVHQKCSEVTSGSALSDHPLHCSGNYIGYWRLNVGQLHKRQIFYLLY